MLQLLTLHSSFMRREDAGVSAGGGADIQMKLDVFLQSEALSVVAPRKDGFAVLLVVVTGDTNVKSSDIIPQGTLQGVSYRLPGSH